MLKDRLGSMLPILALVGICVINYGWGMNRLGVHADDWFWFAEYHFGGLRGVITYGAVDRLLIGVPFGLLGQLVGLQPVFWHMAVVALHICAVLLVWRLLLIWTDDDLFSLATAALFAIHPAVSVVVWISRLPSILSLTLFLLSLLLSVSESTRPAFRRISWILAILLSPISLLIYELPLALEPIRLLLMLHIAKNRYTTTQEWRVNVFRRWLPFVTVYLLFFVWRFWLAPYVLPESRGLGNGWPGLTAFINGEIRGLYQLLAYSWRVALGRLINAGFAWLPWLLGALASFLVLFVGIRLSTKTLPNRAVIYLQAIIVGSAITVLGVSIPIVAGYPVPTPTSLFSRVNSVAVIGVAIGMVGAISWGIQWLRLKSNILLVLCVAVLVGLGTANNYLVNENYIQSWDRQRDLWWQIAWRVPDLRPGTFLLIGSQESLSDLDNNYPPPWGISDPLAFIYGKHSYWGEYLDTNTEMRFGSDGLMPVLGSELIPAEKLLVAYYGDGCLKFADPARPIQDVGSLPFITMASQSNLDNILPGDFDLANIALREIVLTVRSKKDEINKLR